MPSRRSQLEESIERGTGFKPFSVVKAQYRFVTLAGPLWWMRHGRMLAVQRSLFLGHWIASMTGGSENCE